MLLTYGIRSQCEDLRTKDGEGFNLYWKPETQISIQNQCSVKVCGVESGQKAGLLYL